MFRRRYPYVIFRMAGPIAAADACDQNSRVDTPQRGNKMSNVPPREGGTFHFGTFAIGFRAPP
jgi:hypothetical protein